MTRPLALWKLHNISIYFTRTSTIICTYGLDSAVGVAILYGLGIGDRDFWHTPTPSPRSTQIHAKWAARHSRGSSVREFRSLYIITIFKSNYTLNPFLYQQWIVGPMCAFMTLQRRRHCSIDFLYLLASTVCLVNISQDADTISLRAISVRVVW